MNKSSYKKGFEFLTAALLLGGFFVFSAGKVFADPTPLTNVATSVTSTDVTLNGTNGDTDASGHSFWVSLNPSFDISTPSIPADTYSTPDFGSISANNTFSASLSSLTTSGVPGNLPTITPSTTYYYVAWANINGTWSHGSVQSFKTLPTAPVIDTHPADPSNSLAFSFTFHDDQPGVTFKCTVDGDPYQTCTSPFTGTTNAVQHTFYVKALDGTNESAVTSFTWTVTSNPNPITLPASNLSMTGATLNGANGNSDADDSSFWWGTTSVASFSTPADFPASNWSHDNGLGPVSTGASFSNGITGLTPNTTYYYTAWSHVGGVWYPGAIQTFTTPATPPIAGCIAGNSFDTFTNGSVNNQDGWSSTGSFDQGIVDNTYGFSTFGCKSLRFSDSITSGSFGDQTFSPSVLNEAGETDALNGGMSGGIRKNHFEAQFDLASTLPTLQSGMHLSVSPDRGDGARMSYLRFEDQADGIHVFFDDVTDPSHATNADTFNETDIATLTRSPHTIKFSMNFIDGPDNDIVNIYIDGNLVHTGTSWEDYYRFDEESNPGLAQDNSRTVDSLLFRESGSADVGNAGRGFLIDNLSQSSSVLNPNPTTNAATTITPTDATLNGINGEIAASQESFWVSTETFDTSTPNIPANVYSTPVLGGVGANANFTDPLSIVSTQGITTGGVPGNLAITPNTSYYYVAWVNVNGTWYPGTIQTFTTSAAPDTTAPATPTLISPVDGIHRKTSNSNLSDWSDVTDPSSPVVYYYESSGSTSTKPDGSFTSTYYQSGALIDSQIFNPGEPEVTYYWHVKACDSLNNCSPWSNAWQINIDNTAPTIPANGTPNNTTLTTNNFDFNWDASTDNSPVTYIFQSSQDQTSVGGVLTNGLWTSGVLNSNTIHSSGAGDGKWYWQVKATDAAGNTSGWSPIWNVTLDTTAPTTPIPVSPADNTFTTTAGQTLIDWTDSVDATSSPVTYIYEASNTSSTNVDGSFVTPIYTSGTLTISEIPTPGTPEGIYYWHVKAVDAAGNSSPWSVTQKITVDNTAPTATIIFPTAGPAATSFQVAFSEPVKSIEASDPANYFLNNWPGAGGSGPLTGNAIVSYDEPTQTATVTFTTAGWYISPEQQWGVQNIHDLANNLLSPSPTTAYSTPLVNPTAPGTPTTTTPTTLTTQDWTWATAIDPTDSTNASGINRYEYSTDDINWTSVGNVLGVTTNFGVGSYTLHVRAVDNAGNVSSESTGEVVVNHSDQTITASADSNGSINPSGGVTIAYGSDQSFTITPNAGYHVADVLVDGASVGVVTSYDFTSVTQPHTIEASFALNTQNNNQGGSGGGTTTGGGRLSNFSNSQNGQVLGAEKFIFTLLLKKGSKGNEVTELQKFLNAAGYDCGAVDGNFGGKTKACVIKFQLANGLKADGTVGAKTRAVLNK